MNQSIYSSTSLGSINKGFTLAVKSMLLPISGLNEDGQGLIGMGDWRV
jgi:hypothetical protein